MAWDATVDYGFGPGVGMEEVENPDGSWSWVPHNLGYGSPTTTITAAQKAAMEQENLKNIDGDLMSWLGPALLGGAMGALAFSGAGVVGGAEAAAGGGGAGFGGGGGGAAGGSIAGFPTTAAEIAAANAAAGGVPAAAPAAGGAFNWQQFFSPSSLARSALTSAMQSGMGGGEGGSGFPTTAAEIAAANMAAGDASGYGAGSGGGGGGFFDQYGKFIPTALNAIGSLASAGLQSKSVSGFQDATAAATAAAIAEQRRQFDLTRGDYAPYREVGVDSLRKAQSGLNELPTPEEVMSDPGYQFGLAQGQQAIDRKAAAAGGRISGASLKAANEYATNYATTGYNAAYQRRQDRLNRLQALAGLGQTSTTGSAAAGANATNAISGLISNQGDSAGLGQLASGNIWGNAINQLTATGSRYLNGKNGGGANYG